MGAWLSLQPSSRPFVAALPCHGAPPGRDPAVYGSHEGVEHPKEEAERKRRQGRLPQAQLNLSHEPRAGLQCVWGQGCALVLVAAGDKCLRVQLLPKGSWAAFPCCWWGTGRKHPEGTDKSSPRQQQFSCPQGA